jgi:hypothetical protein
MSSLCARLNNDFVFSCSHFNLFFYFRVSFLGSIIEIQ